jgi:L-rhamnose-H+ transport protein
MDQNISLGLLLIAAGAFSSGSFAIPFGKIRNWKWETYWLIFSLGAYILFPLAACIFLAPDFVRILGIVPSKTLAVVFALGTIYGIGNLSFGLSLRYLGISMGYSLSLGLMLAIGTLIPPVLDGRLDVMMAGRGGNLLIAGVLIAVIGIALTGLAGFLKDKSISDSGKKESVSEFNYIKGAVAALLVGVTGSAMSLGFEQGIPIAGIAAEQGINPLFVSMPVMLVLLSGTFVTTLVWCICLGVRNKSLGNYTKAGSEPALTANYLFALLSGFLWFTQFILFGMGKSKMGPFTFTSWGILMGLTIVFATLWGLIRKEWRGVSSGIYALMVISLLVIIISSFMIGISGSF